MLLVVSTPVPPVVAAMNGPQDDGSRIMPKVMILTALQYPFSRLPPGTVGSSKTLALKRWLSSIRRGMAFCCVSIRTLPPASEAFATRSRSPISIVSDNPTPKPSDCTPPSWATAVPPTATIAAAKANNLAMYMFGSSPQRPSHWARPKPSSLTVPHPRGRHCEELHTAGAAPAVKPNRDVSEARRAPKSCASPCDALVIAATRE